MAFSFFLALFPAIIFLFTLVPFIPIENFDQQLQQSIEAVMPENVHHFIFESVQDIRKRSGAGLLSLGFALSIFFASNGMMSMLRGFKKTHTGSFRSRNAFQKRGVAILLTLLLSILLVVAVASISLGNKVIAYVLNLTHYGDWEVIVFQIVKWILVVGIFYIIFSMVYRFGPALRDRLGFFNAGASLATMLGLLSSIIFSYVIDNFGNQSRIYGSLGAIMVTMIWMQINCFIILVGFELNASIAVNRDLGNTLKTKNEDSQNTTQSR